MKNSSEDLFCKKVFSNLSKKIFPLTESDRSVSKDGCVGRTREANDPQSERFLRVRLIGQPRRHTLLWRRLFDVCSGHASVAFSKIV